MPIDREWLLRCGNTAAGAGDGGFLAAVRAPKLAATVPGVRPVGATRPAAVPPVRSGGWRPVVAIAPDPVR